MFRGLGLDLGRRHPQGLHVFPEGGDVAFRHFFPGEAQFLRPADDLVVDVGEIAHPGDLEAQPAQVAHQDFEGHAGAGVPQVAVVVDRHPAGIQADLTGNQGLEGFFPSA